MILGLSAGASSAGPGRGGERGKDTAPRAGDAAVDFTLKVLGEDEQVTLSAAAEAGPVALVFGSYT